MYQSEDFLLPTGWRRKETGGDRLCFERTVDDWHGPAPVRVAASRTPSGPASGRVGTLWELRVETGCNEFENSVKFGYAGSRTDALETLLRSMRAIGHLTAREEGEPLWIERIVTVLRRDVLSPRID